MLLTSRNRQTFLVLAAVAALLPTPLRAQVVWNSDYAAARKEAAEKGRPLLLEFSTDNCVWCRKLESGTLRDPQVVAALTERFVCLKVDGDRDPMLVGALRVTTFPTIVLAAADGKILNTLEGYQEKGTLLDQLNRAAPPTPTPDWMVQDYQDAARAIAISDYSRAIIMLKGVSKDGGDRPIQVKSRQVLNDLEQQAATQFNLAKHLTQRGRGQEAVDVLTDLVRSYAGTQAAIDSATLMTTLAAKPEVREGLRVRKARELLAQARDEYRSEHFLNCMERCELLTTSFSDLDESKEAKQLAETIRENPEYLAKACEALNHRTGAMYLSLAECWLKKGQTEQAILCLERVAKMVPGSNQADAAQERIAAIRQPRTSAYPPSTSNKR